MLFVSDGSLKLSATWTQNTRCGVLFTSSEKKSEETKKGLFAVSSSLLLSTCGAAVSQCFKQEPCKSIEHDGDTAAPHVDNNDNNNNGKKNYNSYELCCPYYHHCQSKSVANP